MKIAAAQLNTRPGDFDNTASRMIELSQSAADQGADLLVFSFTTLTGASMPDYSDLEGYLIDLNQLLPELAAELACPSIVTVLGDLCGSAVQEPYLLQDGKARRLRKPANTPQDELEQAVPLPDYHNPASDLGPLTFEFAGLRLGIAYNYPEIEAFVSQEVSVDALIFISQYSFAIDDPASAMGAALAENRFCSDAVTLDAWIVGVSSVGGYDLRLFAGSSFVMNPAGKLVASAPAFEDALITGEVLARKEEAGASSQDEELISPEIFNRSLHLWEALTLSLHDYAEKLSHENVALMLDGGLNSSVLVALATDALGPTHVFGLVADDLDAERDEAVEKLAKSLRITLVRDTYEMPANADKSLRADMLQAQLAQCARDRDALVLGSQDKTFLALEAPSTNVRAASLLPLGDVYRSDVLELAHMRNTISPIMPARIFSQLEVPDIEGLKEVESTPKLQLERVDVTLANRIEWGRPLTDVIARQSNPELTGRIIERLRDTEQASMSWPPCLTITSRTLREARGPLGMAWKDKERASFDRTTHLKFPEKLFYETDDETPAVPESLPEGLSDMLAGMEGSSVQATGSIIGKINAAEIESSLGDLISLIKDMIQDNNLPIEGRDGPMGPFTWGSPFSEN